MRNASRKEEKVRGTPLKINLDLGGGGEGGGGGGKKKSCYFEAVLVKFKADISELKADFLVGKWC